jgi:nucleoside-diphosphate-sugar epimerase/predicted dehydrogenase
LEVSETAAAELRRLYPELHVRLGDFRTLLSDAETLRSVDGVVVALPNHLHGDAAARSIQARLPVLCEKPLANESHTCRQLDALAVANRCPLAVAMVRRLIPWVGAVRNALRTGLVGAVESIEIEHGGRFEWPTASEAYFTKQHGGIFLNMGVHYLDMVEDWVGRLMPREYRDDFEGGVEANASMDLRSASGVRIRLMLSYTHGLRNEMVLRGSKGEIRANIDSFDSCTWTSYEAGVGGELRPVSAYRSGLWPRDFVASFAEQFHEFALVIDGREVPRVTGTAAAATLELIEWAYRNRQRIFHVPGPRTSLRTAIDRASVVVTGGTGFIGGRLVNRLAELGCAIRVPVRTAKTSANVSRFPIERTVVDLSKYRDVHVAMRDARYVFHLAYGTGGRQAGKATIASTRNVVDAAIAAGAEAVVVVSTASVFGQPSAGTPVDETAPYRPSLGEYGASKARAEQYCLRRAKTSGRTRIVVINPTAVFGPGGVLFTELPARLARDRQFCWIEGGRGKLNYTYADNLVDALLLAAQNTQAHQERFIINDGAATFREFLTPILGKLAEGLPSMTRSDLLDMQRRRRGTLRELAHAMASDDVMQVVNRMPLLAAPKRLLENYLPWLYAVLQRQRVGFKTERGPLSAPCEPPDWLADIFGPIEGEYSSAKAQRVLGWRPAVTLEEGISASIAWLTYVGLREESC